MVSQELSDGLGRIGARLLNNPNSGSPGVVTLPTTFLLSPLMARLSSKIVLGSFRDNVVKPRNNRSKRGRERNLSRYSSISLGPGYLDPTFVSFCISFWCRWCSASSEILLMVFPLHHAHFQHIRARAGRQIEPLLSL